MKKNIFLIGALSLALMGCFNKKEVSNQKESAMTPKPLVEENAPQPQNNPNLPPGHPPISGNPHAGMGMENPHGMMGGMMKAISGIKPTPQVPEEVIKAYPGATVVFIDKQTQKPIKKADLNLGDEVEVNGYKVKLIYVIPDLKVGDKGTYFVASLEPVNPALWLEIYKDGKLIFRGPVFANFPTLTDPNTGFIIFVENIKTTRKESTSLWEKNCASCHGTTAPSKETLLSKYKTKEEFVKAAKKAAKAGKMPQNLPFEKVADELFSK